MPLTIIRQTITEIEADAIVNTANPYPVVGAGTDTAVYEAAGREELLAAREAIGEIPVGCAAVTEAFHLPAKYVIHAVGPVWRGGRQGEQELLKTCYRNALQTAVDLGCESAAFPLLGSGSNGFPKDLAFRIALDAIQAFLLDHEINVILAVYDRESYQISKRLFADITSYIEDHQVREPDAGKGRRRKRADAFSSQSRCRENLHDIFDNEISIGAIRPDAFVGTQMEEARSSIILPPAEETFQVKLLSLIDASGESDPAVYKRANIDRKLFAKIRKDVNYRPSRKTAVSLALALNLSLDRAQDLLSRAGYALSLSNTGDLILRYCFENGIYNLMDVNQILLSFDQEML